MVRRSRRASAHRSCRATSGLPLSQVERSVVAQSDQRGVRDGGGGRVPWTGVEQGQLAEHLTRAQDGEKVLAAVTGRAPQFHLAIDDHVQPVARVALVEEHL